MPEQVNMSKNKILTSTITALKDIVNFLSKNACIPLAMSTKNDYNNPVLQ
jgi:hypothetical protein